MSELNKSLCNGCCVLCTEAYDEQVKIPKFLSCFHTFCASCLQSLCDDDCIECPLCLKETSMGEHGVDQLQTNFYVLLNKSARKSAGAKVEVNYCTECKRSPVFTCFGVHNVVDLNDDEISGSIYLQVQLITCKTHWTAALNKRHEIRDDLDDVFQAVSALKQQILVMKKENERLIRNISGSMDDLKGVSPMQDDPVKVVEMLEKLGKIAEKADRECQVASALSSACEAIRSSKLSADISASDGTRVNLFKSKQLDFTPQDSDAQLADCWSILSYLILQLRHPKELEALNVNRATPDVQVCEKNAKREKTPVKVNKEVKNGPPAASQGAKTKSPPIKDAAKVHKVNENPKNAKEDAKKVAPARPPPVINANKKRCYFTLSVNGKFYGKICIEPRFDVAPIMCTKFVENCANRKGPSYVGSVIYGAKPKDKILGGRINGNDELYMADRSPLKRTRGAILLRLKRDLTKTHCFIVSSEFFILLQDKPDPNPESTVFGFVCDGLAVCDAMSHLNYSKDHVTISDAGVVA